MEKELTFKLIQYESAFRMVIWEEGAVVEIIETSTMRSLLNYQLRFLWSKNFTDAKFSVRL